MSPDSTHDSSGHATSRGDATADAPDAGGTRDGGNVVLRGTDLCKTYGGSLPFTAATEVLDGVNVELYGGQITGIVGANGSGKSTLLKILAGIDSADSGTVERIGDVGWCPQSSRLYERLTVRETFELFGTGHGLDDDAIEDRMHDIADRLDFVSDLDTLVEDLSGGNRQKVNLGVSLVHEPDVLLLDEPYTGFDWETYLAFWELTDDLKASGTGIAIVSHLLRKRDRFDRVYELEDGTLREAERDE
ncbi:ATP-binding cassette domain-containing protein [Halorussus caseinilyticus]|uniref:ATP-binding cassette domain-containing protein n=1 Tax=Halorussus caseinilyticus TaxID=3034025 RepID=A0ABD5WJH5_9EURY|nr:ABC transporter ATP-binding protein [Halorussus sp. DT72]